MTRRRIPIPRPKILLGVGTVLVSMVAGLFLSAWLFGGPDGRPTTTPPRAGGDTNFSPTAVQASPARSTSVVARVHGTSVAVYRSPHSSRPYRRVAARTVEGRRLPLVLLVKSRRAGWVRAYLPVRPNRTSGWVRARDVSLATDDYRLKIELRRHRLTAWSGRKVILRERIATGRALSPTPTGLYFVTDLLRPPDPHGFYGPYALGLSAYSPVLTSFAGGDGQVGIHGTNNPSVIGTNVSHGCIRLRNRAITRLSKLLPLGTPVVIEH